VSLVVAFALVVAVEYVSNVFHPFPEGVEPTHGKISAHVAACPTWVLALAVAAWGLTTFVSAWLATRLGAGRHPAHGFVVGSILLLAAVANMLMLPYPIWFTVLNLVILPLAIYSGATRGRGRRAASEPTANRDGM
jgi:hypothetical protein